MTQSTPSIEALAENVRHNEKNIDLLRQEVSQRFDKVDERIERLSTTVNRLGWGGLIGLLSILATQLAPKFLG